MATHSIEVSEEAGVRHLHFGSDWIQGAMRVSRPWALELEYTREMMACLLFRPDPDWPRRALLIGQGAGSLTKFLYRHRPHCALTVVEIDPRVVAVSQSQFQAPPADARLRIEIDDGAHFIQHTAEHYDLILVDGFDAHARAGALATPDFYRHCRDCLTPGGLMVVNLFGRTRGHKAAFGAIFESFEGRSLAFPSCDAGNSIAFACRDGTLELDLLALGAAALTLKQTTGLNLAATLVRLQNTRTG